MIHVTKVHISWSAIVQASSTKVNAGRSSGYKSVL